MAQAKAKKKKYSKLNILVIFAALLLVAAVAGYECKSLLEQKEELTAQASELEEKIEDAEDEYADLEEKESYMTTKKYVEEVARNQLGLVYPDEIVIRAED